MTRWNRLLRGAALVPAALLLIALTASAVGDTCTPPPSGMVSWWPGDGNANDIAGGNNGNFVGATTGPGLVSDAFSFNGSSYVSVPGNSSLDFSRELTLDAWIFIDNDAPANMGIVSKYYPVSDHRGYFLSIASNKLGLRASNQDETLSCDQSSSGDVPRGEWVHVATTVSSSACQLYMNGELVSSTAGIPNIRVNPNVPNLIIGAHGFGDLARFKGRIDEVEAFDRALSQAEIQAIYEAGANGKCKDQACATPPPDMVSWFRAENDTLDVQGMNHGAAAGGVGFSAGMVGQAFDFDGTGSVSLGNSASLQSSGALTVDAWVRPDNDSGFKYTIAKWRAGGSQSSWLLAMNGAAPRIFMLGNGGPGGTFTEVQGGSIPTGPTADFTHIAMTYSTTDVLRLYINGVLAGTGANVGTIANTVFQEVRLGTASSNEQANEFFVGSLDEVEIFDRALTATEIREIYAAGANGKCTPPDPDFGDAPAPYPTLLADNGARHAATGPLLGATRDTEADGQPGAAADGDGEDEDGIATPIVLAAGKDDVITVTIGEDDGPVDAFLNVWIDFDNDGSWDQAGDQVLLDQPVTSGDYTVAIPGDATRKKPLGTYYGRLRICSTVESCSTPTGAADDGEVEDYAITLDKHSPGSQGGGGGDGGSGAADTLLLILMALLGLWVARQRDFR